MNVGMGIEIINGDDDVESKILPKSDPLLSLLARSHLNVRFIFVDLLA